MTTSTLNDILTIPHPEQFICQLFHYRKGHSMLFVELRNPTNIEAGPLYLVFEQVEYFSGLTIWKGANFAVAPDEECFKLLKLRGYGEIATLEQIREHVPFRLYTVPGTEPQVQILSAKAYWTANYDVVRNFAG